jgi:hypothetical protein
LSSSQPPVVGSTCISMTISLGGFSDFTSRLFSDFVEPIQSFFSGPGQKRSNSQRGGSEFAREEHRNAKKHKAHHPAVCTPPSATLFRSTPCCLRPLTANTHRSEDCTCCHTPSPLAPSKITKTTRRSDYACVYATSRSEEIGRSPAPPPCPPEKREE